MSRTSAWLLVALLISGAAVGQESTGATAGQADSPASNIVATVNGEPIYFEALESRLGEMHSGMSETRRGGFDLGRLMFRVVNDALLAQEGRAMGLQQEGSIPGKLDDLRRRLALKRLEFEEVVSRIEVDDSEVRALFERDYGSISFRMITTYERDELDSVLARLNDGESFEDLARESSVDQYGPRGGLVENLLLRDMPWELRRATLESEPGIVHGPLQTSLGWSLLRVESVAEPDPELFPRAEQQIRGVLRLRQAERLREELARRVIDSHTVVVDDEVVASIGGNRLPDGRLVPVIDDPSAVVATVGEVEILAEEYGRGLMSGWKGVRNEEAALASRSMILDGMVFEELLVAEALRRGYAQTPEVDRSVEALETQLLVPEVLARVVTVDEVDPEEAKAYYEENLERYRKPPRLHVSQLTVATTEEADEMMEQLRQGADFAWLARRHSLDGLRDQGGAKGWVVAGQGTGDMPRAVLEGAAGEVIGPMGYPGEYTVYRVNVREEQGHYSMEEAAQDVNQAVLSLKFGVALDEFIQKLRSRSEIVVHQDVIDSLAISGTLEEDVEDTSGHG